MQRYFKRFPYIFMICFIFPGCCVIDDSPEQFPMHCVCSNNVCCTTQEKEFIPPTPGDTPTRRDPKPSKGNKHAVLISAGVAADTELASEYWDDLVLQYRMLIDNGFPEDQICVLYDKGQDYNATDGHSITDLPVSITNIESVFKALGGVGSNVTCVKRPLTDEDLLYIWWMGHGGNYDRQDTCSLSMPISGSNEEFKDYEFINCINQVSHYKRRVVAIMTCHSGGILDNMADEGSKTVTLASSECEEYSKSSSTCDGLSHAEFTYELTNALRQEKCGSRMPVENLTDGDNYVSLWEVYLYISSPLGMGRPIPFDNPNNISISTYLSGP